jgi:hypothetical protein
MEKAGRSFPELKTLRLAAINALGTVVMPSPFKEPIDSSQPATAPTSVDEVRLGLSRLIVQANVKQQTELANALAELGAHFELIVTRFLKEVTASEPSETGPSANDATGTNG